MTDVDERIAAEMSPDDPEADPTDDPDADPDEQPDGQPDEAQAAVAPRSQKEIDQVHDKLKAEANRHAKRVEEIMGDDFALLVPSPVDWTPGFIFNVPGMLPFPEQVAALDELIGRGAAADYEPAEDAEACDKCHALGLTLTGSRVDGQVTKPCGKCNGTGWVTKFPPLAEVPSPPYMQPLGTAQPTGPNQIQVADRWGRPAGHPHYGIEPAAITA